MQKIIVILLTLLALFIHQGKPAETESKEKKKKPKLELGWHKKAAAKLNFTKNSYDNWAVQGGENSWSWQLDLLANVKHVQKKYQWEVSGKFSFGRTKVVGTESQKTEDEIRLESIFSFKAIFFLKGYISLLIQSQLAPGYDYETEPITRISNFLDPVYITQSMGFDYQPGKIFKTRAGFALKETFTRNHPVPYADNPETDRIERVKVEVGLNSTTDVNIEISEIISFTSRFELFSNFRGFDSIDIYWDNLFLAKIAKFVVVSFNLKLIYDKDVSPRRQLKQTLAVGLMVSFFKEKKQK